MVPLRCRAGAGGRGGVTGESGADGRGCGRGDACDAREGQALVAVRGGFDERVTSALWASGGGEVVHLVDNR